jgi:hypothetical protein
MKSPAHSEAIAKYASKAEEGVAEAEATVMNKLQSRCASAKQGWKMLNMRGDSCVTSRELQASLAARFDLALSEVCCEFLASKYGSSKGINYAGYCKLYEGTLMPSISATRGFSVAAKAGE